MLLEMLDAAEVITKTACVRPCPLASLETDYHTCSEFARVFGVDFFSVISRGSQFKVESFMFRIAKPESFVFISPSKSDVSLLDFRSIQNDIFLHRLENKMRQNACL